MSFGSIRTIAEAMAKKSWQHSSFRTEDEVYFCPPSTSTSEGPYLVASVPEPKKYILCHADDSKAKNGEIVEERNLRKPENTQQGTG